MENTESLDSLILYSNAILGTTIRGKKSETRSPNARLQKI